MSQKGDTGIRRARRAYTSAMRFLLTRGVAMLLLAGVADAAKSAGPRYVVKHEWGDGAHSDAHGGAILPDILRWIWPKV